MKIDEIKTQEPFNSIFDINDAILQAIKENMEEQGYDEALPIVLWGNIVIDGHTRLEAAKQAGIKDIPVVQYEFKSERHALEYAIHNQRNRRNLTQAEILRCIEALDKRQKRGGDRKSKEFKNQIFGTKNLIQEQKEPSHKKTAEILGVGSSTVSNARTILDSDNEEIKNKVIVGEISIDKAAGELRKEKKERKEVEKPTFNTTNENIDWAKWTWNPITGCKHGCPYCYARDIANRFYPHGFEPHFYPKRLSAPENTKIPENRKNESGIHNVFTVSMGDMLGDWVKKEWIEQVIESMKKSPQWNCIILTKNPKRYLEFRWPETCWLGATADTQKRMNLALEIFEQINHPTRFISCEPLMEHIVLPKNPPIEWLIVGGRSRSTGMSEGQPEWKWVKSLIIQCNEFNIPLFMKPNLTVRSKEYPEIIIGV
jgi:protein gp37